MSDKKSKVTSTGKLEVNLQARYAKTLSGIAVGVTEAALILRGNIRKRILKGPKTGIKRGKHRASAPGEAPANDTGKLQRSAEVVNAKPIGDPVAVVVIKAPYAKALEYGTKLMDARPFVQPSIEESLPAMKAAIEHYSKA